MVQFGMYDYIEQLSTLNLWERCLCHSSACVFAFLELIRLMCVEGQLRLLTLLWAGVRGYGRAVASSCVL